jgi:hypothetical protein
MFLVSPNLGIIFVKTAKFNEHPFYLVDHRWLRNSPELLEKVSPKNHYTVLTIIKK